MSRDPEFVDVWLPIGNFGWLVRYWLPNDHWMDFRAYEAISVDAGAKQFQEKDAVVSPTFVSNPDDAESIVGFVKRNDILDKPG